MKQTKRIVLAFTVLPLSLLCLLFLKTSPRDQRNTTKEETVTPVLISSKLSTKWWIKATVTSTAAPTGTNYPLDPTHQVESNCFSGYSEPLQTGTYAYISPAPPVPNRIRAGAGKDNTYLGQVQPGTGVKIIDGPVCADGSFWWLVKSKETRLRGWTVMGNGSQQWIISCPNPNIACEKLSLILTKSVQRLARCPEGSFNLLHRGFLILTGVDESQYETAPYVSIPLIGAF